MFHFSLRVIPGSSHTKVVISVSKKIFKKAVVRNKIKRRIRAIVSKLNLKPNSYLVIAKSGAEEIRGKELEGELFRLTRSIRN